MKVPMYGTTAEIYKLNAKHNSNREANINDVTRPILHKQPSKSIIDITDNTRRQCPHHRDLHDDRSAFDSSNRELNAMTPSRRNRVNNVVNDDDSTERHFVSYHKAKDRTIAILRYIGILNWLLLLLPVSIALWVADASPIAQFVTAAVAIIPAAGWMGDATEQLSDSVGPGLGGLLNATFGNAAELIISLFAMYKGEDDLVKASLVGSILGNLLLVLGCAILAGGVKYQIQTFSKNAAGVDSNMAVVATVAILVPAIFDSIGVVGRGHSDVEIKLSLGIAVILFVAYISFLVFQLRTHRDYMENFGDFADGGDVSIVGAAKLERSSSEPNEAVKSADNNKINNTQLYDNDDTIDDTNRPPLIQAKSLLSLKDPDHSSASGRSTPRNNGTVGASTPTYNKIYTRAGSLTSATNAAREYMRQSQSMQTLPPRRRTGTDEFSLSSHNLNDNQLDTSVHSDDAKSNTDDTTIRSRKPLSRSGTADERLTRRTHLRKISQARSESFNNIMEATNYSSDTTNNIQSRLKPIAVDENTDHNKHDSSDTDNDSENLNEEDKWSRKKSLIVLTIATAVIAILSEVLTSSVNAFGEALGLGQIFIGVIIVAIVGNAAEHSTAILMALADNMDVAISIAFGSALQIAMFVLPVIVFFSYARASGPMDLLLAQFEVFSIAVAALISWMVVQDGGSHYLEGVMLLLIYLILALGFYFGPSTTANEYGNALYCQTPGSGINGVPVTYSVCPGQ